MISVGCLTLGDRWSLAILSLKLPFSLKMVFPAAFTVNQLVRPELEHALPADKELFAIGKYF
jgi:hypothetical protein